MSQYSDRRQMKLLTRAAGLVFTTLMALPALAQEPNESTVRLIEQVVVTAQRREQSMQDVPIAVSNLSAEQLQDAGIGDLMEVQMLVPSLTMEQNKGPGFATFRIRGIGNLGNIPNFEPAVGLFVDGAYRSRSGLGIGELVDVERIEVLRGPQSTLFGRNVTGGLINVITRRPTEDFEAFVEVGAGDLNELVFKASVSGPLSENVRGRLSAITQSREGSFDDRFQQQSKNDKEANAVRGQLALQPTDRLSILVIAAYTNNDVSCCAPDVENGAISVSLSNIITGGQFVLDNDPTNRVIQQNDTYGYAIDAWEATLAIDYNFDLFTMTSFTSFDAYDIFSEMDAEQTLLDLAMFIDRQTADTFTQEIRLTSTQEGLFDWMLGTAYYRNDFTRGSLDPNEPLLILGAHWPLVAAQAPGTPGDMAFFESVNDTRSLSFFAQGNWQVSERISISAGARWFTEEKTVSIDTASSFAAPPSFVFVFGIPAPVNVARKTDQVAWNLSAQFQATEGSMLYASVSQGAKGGGYDGNWGALTVAEREFSDEEVMSYEAGVKSIFFARHVSMNANIFYSDFDNFQNASFLGTSFLVDNAERVVVQGFELDVVTVLADWLTADFSYAYLDATYRSFTNGPCVFPLTGNCDLSGRSLPLAPENRWHLGLLSVWAAGRGELYTRLDYARTDNTETDNALDPRGLQPSYGLLNGRIGWRDDGWDISAWVANATDEAFVTISAPQSLFGSLDGGRQIFLNDPRTYGLTLRVSF